MSEKNIKDLSEDVFLVINDVWADLIKAGIKTHETRSAYDGDEMKTLFGEDGNGTTKMSIVKWNDTKLKAGPKTIILDEKAKMENYETYDGGLAWSNMKHKDGTTLDRRIMTNFSDDTESKVDEWSIIGTAEMSCETITGMETFFKRAEHTLCPLPGNDFEFNKTKITGLKNGKNYSACNAAIMELKKIENMPTYESVLNKSGSYVGNLTDAWERWYYKLISDLENYRDNDKYDIKNYSNYFKSKEIQLIKMDNVNDVDVKKTLDKTKLYPQFYKGFHSTIDYKNANGKKEKSGGKMRKSRRRRRRGRSTRRRKSSRKSRRRKKA